MQGKLRSWWLLGVTTIATVYFCYSINTSKIAKLAAKTNAVIFDLTPYWDVTTVEYTFGLIGTEGCAEYSKTYIDGTDIFWPLSVSVWELVLASLVWPKNSAVFRILAVCIALSFVFDMIENSFVYTLTSHYCPVTEINRARVATLAGLGSNFTTAKWATVGLIWLIMFPGMFLHWCCCCCCSPKEPVKAKSEARPKVQ